ncbi:hypothetical protein BVC80_1725g3 [Macleaya cordata]|uniref:Uncharacterized protein n=1 Tax=Macleaya cordata TaxID=56857 RepID=A0A200QCE3_MACCD|nr:hypothetical protein BVC80_1725g3 [Macleaya cordata]
MRSWISKQVLKYIEEEGVQYFMVDYIVSSIEKHDCAWQMLSLLQTMLRKEAEMFFHEFVEDAYLRNQDSRERWMSPGGKLVGTQVSTLTQTLDLA